MNPSDVKAFQSGYREGHDGLPPLLPVDMTEHEREDLDAAESPAPVEPAEHDWIWYLMGWTAGQAVATHAIHWPGPSRDRLEGDNTP